MRNSSPYNLPLMKPVLIRFRLKGREVSCGRSVVQIEMRCPRNAGVPFHASLTRQRIWGYSQARPTLSPSSLKLAPLGRYRTEPTTHSDGSEIRFVTIRLQCSKEWINPMLSNTIELSVCCYLFPKNEINSVYYSEIDGGIIEMNMLSTWLENKMSLLCIQNGILPVGGGGFRKSNS